MYMERLDLTNNDWSLQLVVATAVTGAAPACSARKLQMSKTRSGVTTSSPGDIQPLAPSASSLCLLQLVALTLSMKMRWPLLLLVTRSVAAGLRNRQIAGWHFGSAGTVITTLCSAAVSS
jgi:hypothetical protein